MHILIIDDDEMFIKKFKNDFDHRFDALCDDTNYFVYTDGLDKRIFDYKYDLAFLDIDLKTVDGIALAEKLREKGKCQCIIFISSHSYLVHSSLIVHPYFFIRKSEYESDLSILFDLLLRSVKEKYFVPIKSNGMTKVVNLNSIVYVHVDNGFLKIHTLDEILETDVLLKKFVEETNKHGIVRVHQSYAINVTYVLSYTSKEITLAGNNIIPLGRAYKQSFIDLYAEYLIQ